MFSAIFLIFNAVTLYERVQSDRNRVTQALTLALQAATAQGAIAAGRQVTWDAPVAQTAAVQAVDAFLPVQLAALAAHGAQYSPTTAAPPDWTGLVTLGSFQTSNTGGTASLFGQSQSVPGPFVAATVSIPVTERFLGVPLSFTLEVGRVMQVYGYNGQQFTEYP